MILLVPFLILLSTMLWAPGLMGLLGTIGLDGLASSILIVVLYLMFAVAVIDAKGSYKVREHVSDMAPWAVTVVVLCILIRMVGGH